MSRAEYMRKYRKSKHVTVTPAAVTPDQPRVTPVTRNKSGITWHPEISQDRFNGRGIPVDGYVLISMGAVAEGLPECGVVSEQAWRERLTHTCTHGLGGWSCKSSL